MNHRAAQVSIGLAILVQACEGHLVESHLLPPTGGGPSAALAFRIGGSGTDRARGVAVDPSGNVYVAGTFTGSVDFDPGNGASGLTSLGATDGFLAKYTGAGAFVWAVRFGGAEADSVTALVRDNAGNLYVAGGFQGTAATFGSSATPPSLNSAGGEDGFVAKITSDGAVVWARRFGGLSSERIEDVAVDPSGNLYAVGEFSVQADAIPASGGTVVSNGSEPDGFVVSFDGSGAVRWAFPVGGAAEDHALAVQVTSGGSVVVAGTFQGNADFAPGTATSGLVAVGGTDVFVASYTSAGALEWARGIGGTGNEDVATGGLAADAGGGVAATGRFAGSVDFDPGAGQAIRTSLGTSDVYVVRLDASGAFQSVFTLGGVTGTPTVGDLAFAADGNLLVTGSFTGSVDFDPGAGTHIITGLGGTGTDIFVARYAPAGSLLWVSRFGDPVNGAGNPNGGAAVASDASNAVYVAGQFFGTPNFDPGTGSFRLISLGDADGFVVKLTADGALARP